MDVGAGGHKPSSAAIKLPMSKLLAPQPFHFSQLLNIWIKTDRATPVFTLINLTLSNCPIKVIFRGCECKGQHWGTEQLLALGLQQHLRMGNQKRVDVMCLFRKAEGKQG